MRASANSAGERGKLWAFPLKMLPLIEVLLVLVAGWLGIRALLDFAAETRNRDEATVRGYLDSRPQEEDHRPAPAAVPAPAKPAPAKAAPAVAVKAGSRPAPPAERAGRPGEQKAK